jgi:hypothetical protein
VDHTFAHFISTSGLLVHTAAGIDKVADVNE